jgi:hypothetical protein
MQRINMKAYWILIAVLIMAAPSFGQELTFPNRVDVIADTSAATLLLPYFEVDLGNPAGRTTIFSINDADATAILAHVVIYTDLGVPVADFDVYLTGYDVQAINLRDVLNGHLPQTASAGQDPTDTISPHGPLSQDINFASCQGQLPPTGLTAPAGVTPAILKRELTGGAGLGGLCYGLSHNDKIARGYVTVDTVNQCTTNLPGDAGYFVAGVFNGVATRQPLLTGEAFYLDPSHKLAHGGNLVHIHASATDPATSTSGNYTFYGRFDGWNAADNRQPLPTNFGARFKAPATVQSLNNSNLNASASLIVWRDPKVNQGGFTCGSLPTWYPLGQEGLTVFDEQEHVETFAGPLVPFPAATQVVEVGSAQLPVSFNSGWLLLDLNTSVAPGNNPPIDSAASQAFVSVIDSLFGTAQVEHRAAQHDSGTAADHDVP